MTELPEELMVSVPETVIMDIVSWWRGANEAPGGCSPRESIDGMKEAVWKLEMTRRSTPGAKPA